MTLAQAQQSVDEWIKKNGVRYFNELTNMAMLTEEVGEVARIIARGRVCRCALGFDMSCESNWGRPNQGL